MQVKKSLLILASATMLVCQVSAMDLGEHNVFSALLPDSSKGSKDTLKWLYFLECLNAVSNTTVCSLYRGYGPISEAEVCFLSTARKLARNDEKMQEHFITYVMESIRRQPTKIR